MDIYIAPNITFGYSYKCYKIVSIFNWERVGLSLFNFQIYVDSNVLVGNNNVNFTVGTNYKMNIVTRSVVDILHVESAKHVAVDPPIILIIGL